MAIEFTGLKEFQGQNNRLSYVPAARRKARGHAEGDRRPDQDRPHALRGEDPGLAKDLSVRFLDQAKPTAVNDKWNFWVFSLSANAFLMGETQYRSGSYYGSFSANRVTPEFKVRTSVYGNCLRLLVRPRRRLRLQERPRTGTASPASSSRAWASTGRPGPSSASNPRPTANLKLSANAGPAVEYDVFPYSESTKRQLRILYRIGLTAARYHEETVYFKTSERLLQESLSWAYEIVRPWGNASSSSRDPIFSTTSARTGSSSRPSSRSGSGGA